MQQPPAVKSTNGSADGAAPAAVPFIGELCSAPSLLLLVIVAELLALAYTVLLTGVRQFDFLVLAYASLFLLWASLGAALILCRLRSLFLRLSTATSAGISFVICMLWVALLSFAAQRLLITLGGGPLDWWWILDSLVLAAIVVGIGLRYAYLSQQLRLRQQSALHARLDALQSRIQPHFLFNTLNSISSLIAVDPARAEQAVEDLAALFRANLNGSQRLVPWARERALCDSYLRIEQNRLAQRLRINWQEAELPARAEVPSLILQPLLENAILHGIQALPDGGELAVQVDAHGGQLVVVVSNPVPVRPRAPLNGVGNNNIRQRLEALYGSRASLTEQVEDGHFVARLSLPLGPGGEG